MQTFNEHILAATLKANFEMTTLVLLFQDDQKDICSMDINRLKVELKTLKDSTAHIKVFICIRIN
jgi:hypothetical protein